MPDIPDNEKLDNAFKHSLNVGKTSGGREWFSEPFSTQNPHITVGDLVEVESLPTTEAEAQEMLDKDILEYHVVKMDGRTSTTGVTENLLFYAFEDRCTTPGHSDRGNVQITRAMHKFENNHPMKIRVFSGGQPDQDQPGVIDTPLKPGVTERFLSDAAQLPATGYWAWDLSVFCLYFSNENNWSGTPGDLWCAFYTFGENASKPAGEGSHRHTVYNFDNQWDLGITID